MTPHNPGNQQDQTRDALQRLARARGIYDPHNASDSQNSRSKDHSSILNRPKMKAAELKSNSGDNSKSKKHVTVSILFDYTILYH